MAGHGHLVCFVCGEPLCQVLLALRGHDGRTRQDPTLRFHPGCAARLAAAVLQAWLDDGPGPESKAGPALRASPVARARLTRREEQILELIAAGRTNRQIASALALHEKTVKNHVTVILDKLEVRSRTEAAVAAVRAAGRGSAPPATAEPSIHVA